MHYAFISYNLCKEHLLMTATISCFRFVFVPTKMNKLSAINTALNSFTSDVNISYSNIMRESQLTCSFSGFKSEKFVCYRQPLYK